MMIILIGVFDSKTTQKEIFHKTTLPLVDSFLKGNNGLIFAYGITNAGLLNIQKNFL